MSTKSIEAESAAAATGLRDGGSMRDDRGGNAFVIVDTPQPHPQRAKSILSSHPEVRQLFGRNLWSGVLIVVLVGLQLGLAYLMSAAPWWAIVILAYFVGAFANHALWVLVHECAHNLIFRNPTANRVMALVANLPMVLPSTVPFCVWHLKHHRYLGHHRHDADLAPRWEAWLLRGGFVRRLIWQCLFPIFQTLRMAFLDHRGKPASWVRWRVPNAVVQLAFTTAVFFVLGPKALLFLFFSAFFSIGPHPLGARWIQEHYVFRHGQETYSYYGMFNVVALNIGYHNEHHDLPQIPWHRLPALRRLAPEMYDSLFAHRSWTRLWLRFLFDRNLDVFRIAREA